MPRRSDLGWMAVMVVAALMLGFVVGGGLSLLSGTSEGDVTLAATDRTTTTTAAEAVTATPSPVAPADGTTTTAVATTVPPRPTKEISVRVHNGSNTAGQAVRVGDRLGRA